jgi:hypothetical protein
MRPLPQDDSKATRNAEPATRNDEAAHRDDSHIPRFAFRIASRDDKRRASK